VQSKTGNLLTKSNKKNFVEKISIKFEGFLLNQVEFDTNCAVDKHTKESVKISIEICISTDI